MRYPFVALLSAISLSSPAYAGEAPEPESDEAIVVTANRTAQPLSRVGQSVSVVDAAEIARRQTATVVDILRTLPGVSIVRNGGIGTATGVFIRGAESDQTVTLIDGVKLNDPSSPGGGFNFGNLLVGNIDRIEVLRGSQSVLWGSQAIGGVINMITRPPTDALAINARAEYGYRNTGQLVGNISGKLGSLSASGGGGYLRTDGISTFSEARGGAERDGYENYGANANLKLALSDQFSLDARGWYSNGTVGIDGFPAPSFTFADTREIAKTREIVGYAGGNAAFFSGRFRNRLGFAYTDTRRRNDDRGTETFAAKGRNERLEYQGIFEIADGWQATAGLERETSRFISSSFGAAPSIGRARLDSVYGQLVATPVADLTLTGGVRQDDHDRFGGATTFGASGVFRLSGTGLTLRASYAEGFKAPSLFQLQSNFGNQALRPERATGWDAGITERALGGRLEAGITYFRRNSTDLINFISCVPPLTGICTNRASGTYDNVAQALADGIEISLALRPIETLRVQANYTYTNAVNRSSGSANFGKFLVRRPQHSATVLIDYSWGVGLTTGATLTHVGTSFDNASNSRKLQGYVLADVRLSYPVTSRIALYGRIENLFDERYETAFRFGQLGRAAYVGARFTY
ncbi:MAG: TonB-dependent receptor [Sphingomonas sp.]|uniref:TonB-dependent receptor plug domain-containing protein n=1 Tax=Sphingomonas sp. TaxID=28214 RepID=UPI0025CE934D|nr:TonB-dependent receptor [Sphingomonas sp.]MBY0284961.1 TonB-dependent receptor [Sphingomonas sp.]